MRTGPLSEQDLVEICDCVYREGYTGEERIIFEERLNHKLLTEFKDEVVAGQHRDWIEAVIEQSDGRADILPVNLQEEYDKLMHEKRWLEADSLLVNVYTSGISEYLDKRSDPWIANLAYGKDGLETAGLRE